VVALVAIVVGTAVAAATMAVDSNGSKHRRLGAANAMVQVDATDQAKAEAAVTNAAKQYGQIDVVAHRTITVPGTATPLDVRAEDPHGVYVRDLLALRSGRYPEAAGEVALTSGAARLLDARVGDRVDIGGVARTVVGRVENPTDLRDEFVLVPADDRGDAEILSILVDAARAQPGSVVARVDNATGAALIRFGDSAEPVRVLVLVATTLALVLVGLVAAAGFVVVAQRRQRQLGLLAALGATDRHLRLVMLTNGALVGLAGALVGAVAGFLAWIALAPTLEDAVGYRIDRFDLPWTLIAEIAALAVVMAVAAAWWPARQTGRLSVMRALSGRPSPPLPIHRSLGLAFSLIAVGLGCLAVARPTGDVRPWALVVGVTAVALGVVLTAPAMVRAVAAPARHLPFAPRLALRDLARYQARAAAAVAAITLGLGVAVAVVVVSKANEYGATEGNLSDRQLLIHTSAPRGDQPLPAVRDDSRELDTYSDAVLAALGHPPAVPLDIAVAGPAPATPGDLAPVDLAEQVAPNSFRSVGPAYDATPELLRRLGIDPATVDPSADVLSSIAELTLAQPGSRTQTQPRVQRVDLPAYTSTPRVLVTEDAMRRHGWDSVRVAWLVEMSRPLRRQDVAAARRAAADVGLVVEVRSTQDYLGTVRTVASAAGTVLALAIVAITVGLLRAEAAADLRTLTATGAGARTRRALTASTAGALALLGAVLGAAGAYVALLIGYRTNLAQLASPPTVDLVVLLLGVPLAASADGWLLAGREPTAFSRRMMD
jgi:putative ABC transport system permease protein